MNVVCYKTYHAIVHATLWRWFAQSCSFGSAFGLLGLSAHPLGTYQSLRHGCVHTVRTAKEYGTSMTFESVPGEGVSPLRTDDAAAPHLRPVDTDSEIVGD